MAKVIKKETSNEVSEKAQTPITNADSNPSSEELEFMQTIKDLYADLGSVDYQLEFVTSQSQQLQQRRKELFEKINETYRKAQQNPL